MIGTSVLHYQQTHIWSLHEEPLHDREVSKEQECLSLLKRCKNLDEFKQVHAQVLKWGLLSNSHCTRNLVTKCVLSSWGSMDYACSIFDQIDDPGTFEFNMMIRGYAKNTNVENALFFYDAMLERGVQPDNFTYPAVLKACARLRAIEEGKQIHGHITIRGLVEDLFVQNSLINMYGKCGDIELARGVFEQIYARDVASWSAIIAAYASLSMWDECVTFFREMTSEGSCRPEESTLVSVISACTHLGALHLGRHVHGWLLRNISGLNVIVQTSLIDMYVKCGCIDKGLSLFHRMIEKNRRSYSVIISGLAMHRQGREALRVFSKMVEEGLKPDDVIYVGVLSACSHVDEGIELFNRMQADHEIEPTIQHYGCMVDLLGRAGRFGEALDFIKNMPMEPNDVIWRSLLSNCKVYHNLEIGEIAAKRLSQLNSLNPSDHLMLSNMYSRAKKWEDAAKIRTEMSSKGLKQTPGFSFVEVKRQVHKFVSQDRSHPQSDQIYEMIHQMEWQLKFDGYSPDTSQVLLDVDEEEKKQRLRCHSQKLALAFALIQTSQGTPIRIVRNLRMCNDCHTYTKFISTIYEREIIVRERNCFHHFKDGVCSCKDNW